MTIDDDQNPDPHAGQDAAAADATQQSPSTDNQPEAPTDGDPSDDGLMGAVEQTLAEMHDGQLNDDVDEGDDEEDPAGAPESSQEPSKGEEGQPEGDQQKTPETDEKQPETPEFDEKPPEGMSERSQERWNQLTTQRKEFQQQAEHFQNQLEEVQKANQVLYSRMDQSQASPQQLDAMFTMFEAVNTGNLQAAAPLIEHFEQMLGHMKTGLGMETAPTGEFDPDIAEAVQKLEVTREFAQKMQQQRNQQKVQQGYQQQEAQQKQQLTEYQRATQQAAQSIVNLEDGWKRSDPDYGAKKDQLVEATREIMKTKPPHEWEWHVRFQYDQITKTMTSLAQRQQREQAKSSQTLRPGHGSASGHAPKQDAETLEDHIDLELRRMRGEQ